MASELQTLQDIGAAGNLNPVQATRLSELQKAGGTSGTNTPRTDFVTGLTNNLTATDAAGKTAENAAQTKLMDYYSGLPKSVDTFNQLNDQYGVTDQQKLVDSLTKDVMGQQDQLDAIPASVKARSGDFLINNADKTAITTHEQQPVLDNLNKLIRNQQYESVGLQGKQALVSQLLSLTAADQAQGAKPLQLGVDYTTQDRQIADNLLESVLGTKSSAFNEDQNSTDAKAAAAEQEAFQEKMFQQQTDAGTASQNATFAQQDKSAATDFANTLALQNDKQAAKSSSGSGGSSAATKAAQKVTDQKTQDAYNKILASSKTEYDVWKKINDNQKTLAAQGIDVSQLWSDHAALAAKVGTGGSIRASSSSKSL